ncbi:fibroblast growth factor receptor-like [Sycon ciliatum]|uniref:fibroblast growth factor receptor-like n=1 Tax=Sycon ciliatum TaxID=27933 RepID=UPI0031F67473
MDSRTLASDVISYENDSPRVSSARSSESWNQDLIVYGVSIGVPLLLLVVMVLIFWKHRQKMIDADKARPRRQLPSAWRGAELLAASMVTAAGSPVKVIPECAMQVGAQLGQGRYSNVCRATIRLQEHKQRKGSKAVAVKILSNSTEDSHQAVQAMLADLAVMTKLSQHDSIVGILFGGLFQGSPCVVMEYMDGGDLHTYIRHVKACSSITTGNSSSSIVTTTSINSINSSHTAALSIQQAIGVVLQVAKGMAILAEHKVVHRAVSARNMLVREHGNGSLQVKISDLGVARQLLNSHEYHQLTMNTDAMKWMAVQAMRDGVFNTESDIWSFGVLVWEVLTCGEVPYSDVENWLLPAVLQSGKRLMKPLCCPHDVYDLMTSCWCLDASARPSFSQLETAFSNRLQEMKVKQADTCNNEKEAALQRSPLENMTGDQDMSTENSATEFGLSHLTVQSRDRSQSTSLVLHTIATPFHTFQPTRRYTLPPGMIIVDSSDTAHPGHAVMYEQ